jgi:hypothetical protein
VRGHLFDEILYLAKENYVVFLGVQYTYKYT